MVHLRYGISNHSRPIRSVSRDPVTCSGHDGRPRHGRLDVRAGAELLVSWAPRRVTGLLLFLVTITDGPSPNISLEPTGRPAALPRPELRPGRPAAQFKR